jgi:outer membrane protein OmpA-like peptidoglycan-associated protein
MRKDQNMKGTNVNNDFVEVSKDPVTIYPLQNDEHNLGSKQKIVSVSQPVSGSVEKLGIDGLLRYSPSESFRGSDAFTYTVEDESGYKNTASVVIKATAVVKSDIFANPDYATIGADEKARVKVLENDIVKGGADIVSIGKAKHGEAKLLNPKTGEIFYGPEQGFVGTDAFTYTLQNSKGEQSTTSVTIVIERKYDFSRPISIETYQYNQVNIFVFSELGVGSGFEFTSEPKAQYGKAKVVDAQNGIINYKPSSDFTGYDLFFIDIRKGKEAHKVGIVVKVSEQSGLIAKYGLANHTVNASGSELNQVSPIFEYQRLSKDSKIIGVSSTTGDVGITEDNLLTFDYSKLSKEQFAIAYQTEDGNGKLNAGALLINPVDEIGMPLVTKMVLIPDLLKCKTNEPVNVFPMLNDRHLKGLDIKLLAVSKPLNGTVVFKEEDGSVMYIPNLDFNGTDAFTYTVQDENGLTATSAVNVVVMSEVQYKLENEGLNPKLKAFKYATLEPDKGFMNPEKVVDATNGLFGMVEVLNPNTGEIQYTPNTGFAGVDRFNFSMLHKDGSYSNHPVIAVVEDRNEFFAGYLTKPDKLGVFNDEIVFYYPLINKQHPLAQKMRIVDVQSENGGLTDIINETAFSYKPLKGDILTDKLVFKIIDESGKIQENEVFVQLKKESERKDLGTVVYETPVNEVLEISLKDKAQGYTYQDHTNPEKGIVELKSALNLSFQYDATVANENDAFVVALKSPDNEISYINVSIKILKEVDFSMERDRFDNFYLDLLPANDLEFIGLAQPKKGLFQFNYEKGLFTYQPYSQVKGMDRLGIVVKSDSGINSVYTAVQHLDFPSILDGQTAYQGITAPTNGKLLIYTFSNIRNNNADAAVIQKIKSGKNGKLSILSASLGILEYTPNPDAKSDEIEVFIEDKEKRKQTLSLAIRIQDDQLNKVAADKELAMTAAQNMKSFNYELISFLKQENLTMLGVSATGGGEVNVFNLGDGIFSYLPKDGNKGVEYLLVEVQDANGFTFVIPVQVNVVSEQNYSGSNVTYKNVASVQGGVESYQAVLQQAGERLTAVYNSKGGDVRILDANQGIVAYKPFDGFIGEDSYTFEYLNLQGNVIQKQMQVFVRDESASLISMSEIKRQSELVEEKITNVTEVLAFATEQSQANVEEDETDYKQIMEMQALEAAKKAKLDEEAKQAEALAMQQEKERLADEEAKAAANAEKVRQEFLAAIEAQKAKDLAEAQKKAEADANRQAQLMAQNDAAILAKEAQDAESRRLAELEEQRQAEASWLAEVEKQKQAEANRLAELERQNQAEMLAIAAQQQKAEAEAKAKMEADQKAKAEALAVAELAKQKKIDAQASTSDVVVFRNILFDFDKSELRSLSKEELNKIYNYLFTHPDKSLQLDGHADWIGTVEYNLALSERRAKQAYDYLRARGIEESRLIYQYFGEAVPVAPNANPDGTDNPEGRQLNRRCEFSIKTEGTAEIIMKF